MVQPGALPLASTGTYLEISNQLLLSEDALAFIDLREGGIEGESLFRDREDWVRVLGFEGEFSQTIPDIQDPINDVTAGAFSLLLENNSATPQIFQALVDGKIIDGLEIDALTDSAAGFRDTWEWKLKDAWISSMEFQDDQTVLVQLEYRTADFTAYRYGDDHSLDEVVTSSFEPPIRFLDWGDAPVGFPVTASENGARHIVRGPQLGSFRDDEVNGSPSATAESDDVDGVMDDEDGVIFGGITASGSIAAFNVDVQSQTSDPVHLDVWIDFN